MPIDEFLREIKSLSKPGKGFKPHKYIALLAILQLVREKIIVGCQILFDSTFKNRFRELIKEYGEDADKNRPHNPFFHLSTASFWKLIPNEGQESVLAQARTIGSAGELERLISYAELDQNVFDRLVSEEDSKIIEATLKTTILNGLRSRDENNVFKEPREPYSLFRHEADAIAAIERRISQHGLGFLLQNLEVHDPQSNRYFEMDLLLVAPFGIYVVELKHWSGIVEVRPNSWIQNNSFFKGDPHKINNFKAKLVKGLFERRFPSYPSIYFESVVILTNHDTTVEGASIPTTAEHNPTFDSKERFIKYLIHQQNKKGKILTIEQCRAYTEHLKKLHTTGKPRDFLFPGYEIVERLYQHTDRAEVVARRTDIRHRRLSRLRIFFPPTVASENERYVFHERATATLNAVAKTGDHPNILKVWSVPNENNYIIEGSDWSETGSLRDVLDNEKRLPIDRTVAIFKGILNGLEVIHDKLVVHRALSPETILMLQDTPKLMNFDLSYQLEEDRVTVIPDVSKLKRSPYIAPEIYKGSIIPEATADLFSAGVILYEMLIGETPFACSIDLERFGGKLEVSHIEKFKQNNVPQLIEKIVIDLIRLKPDERPGPASYIIEKLSKKEEKRQPTEETNAELKPGDQSGFCQIEDLLKIGAASQIYRAHGAQARQVAIKLYNSDVPLQHVLDEQQFAATIHHPSIVRVDNYNRWKDGRFYISFDWVSDQNLRDEIENGIRPDIDRFAKVTFQIIDALASLHDWAEDEQPNHILHNDVKPENILLTERDRPVLIDFGSASHPHVGIYEGTEGYVAPDLKLGQDRKYCEDGDLFALGVTLFEWLCGCKPSQHSEKIDVNYEVPPLLLDWLHKAAALESIHRFSSTGEMRKALKQVFETIETTPDTESFEEKDDQRLRDEPLHDTDVLERVRFEPEEGLYPNPFVAYLNSLHCRGAGSENALAESQVRNEFFGFIHVPHPISDTIQHLLLGEKKRHVVLTGHAGDGKSTIAMELYKRFKNRALEQPLSEDLARREDFKVDGISISIIKDYSEWSSDERAALINEMVSRANWRCLLVTNTGTLLDAFCDYEKKAGGDWVHVESDILNKIDDIKPSEMPFHNSLFSIINLSMTENIEIAEQIFQRMILPERWGKCLVHDCRQKCPIFRNVELIQHNENIVRERIFLSYRRLYEYGTRFTLRQLSGHLAYMITSGLSYQDIVNMSRRASPPLITDFMFFNRFFGDNGRVMDVPALQLRVVRKIREQGFGVQPCPSWERKLWLQSKGLFFQLNASNCAEEFERLRKYGARLIFDEGLKDSQAREQVRRILFFLHRFDQKDDGIFIKTFLNSLMILDFARWQKMPNENLSLQENTDLYRRILHVLQEHFSGVKLPEGASSDRSLFITLSRHSHEVRQSAQVVMARFVEDDFKLKLKTVDNGIGGIRRELVLEGKEGRVAASLSLGLPFLDYVMMRNQGELGEDLQVSYVNRLEEFKGRLIRKTATEH